MIITEIGELARGLYAIGNMIFPAFVITGRQNIMIDAGIAVMGPVYLPGLVSLLGEDRKLDKLLITHSHFDHVGAASYLKKKIPGLEIGASPLCREALSRPRVVEIIRTLSEDYEGNFMNKVPDEETSFESFEIDIDLNDNMEFDLGDDMIIKVIATPGHTHDCVSFYLPHVRALIPGESGGMPNDELEIFPEFLSSFDDYMASLRKFDVLDVDMILLPHGKFLTGEHAEGYFERSIEHTLAFKDKLVKLLNRFDGDQEKVAEEILLMDPVGRALNEQQGSKAFLLSLKAQINVIAKREN